MEAIRIHCEHDKEIALNANKKLKMSAKRVIQWLDHVAGVKTAKFLMGNRPIKRPRRPSAFRNMYTLCSGHSRWTCWPRKARRAVLCMEHVHCRKNTMAHNTAVIITLPAG